MPRNDLSEIVLVVDRSGSMDSCRADAEGGINNFIEEQKKVAGEANFTLVQFDTEYEVVHNGVSIKDVPKYVLVPRGWTALLDAVGRAITTVGERLDKMQEAEKPGCVIVVIVTDGQENSSKEYTREQICQMITLQQETYSWKFVYLGADPSAFVVGNSFGISKAAVAQYDPKEINGAYRATSGAVGQVRCCAAMGQDVPLSFTDEQRKKMRSKGVS